MSSRRARAAFTVKVLGLLLSLALAAGVPALADGADPTSTAVLCSPDSVVTGVATTCTVTVTDTASVSPSTPTGTVAFTPVTGGTFGAGGACTLSSATGASASCQVSFTPGAGGGFTVGATYTPATTDVVHAGSDGSTAVTAVDTTGVTVSCPATGATAGDPTTCRATVSDPTSGGQAITGSLSFALSPDEPGSLSGICASSGSTASSAFCSVTFTPPQTGAYTLTAYYSGDTFHALSAGTVSVNVQSGASTEATPLGSTSLAESGAAVLPTSVTSGSANSGPSLGVIALLTKATLASRRKVGVKLRCTAATGAACDGTVALYMKVLVTRKAATGTAATRTTRTAVIVELGVERLALRKTGKKAATLNVALSRTGTRLIAALLGEHRRSVRVSALVRQAGVTALNRVLTLSLVTHKKHAKKHVKKHKKKR